jgi:hypothetical protein
LTSLSILQAPLFMLNVTYKSSNSISVSVIVILNLPLASRCMFYKSSTSVSVSVVVTSKSSTSNSIPIIVIFKLSASYSVYVVGERKSTTYIVASLSLYLLLSVQFFYLHLCICDCNPSVHRLLYYGVYESFVIHTVYIYVRAPSISALFTIILFQLRIQRSWEVYLLLATSISGLDM